MGVYIINGDAVGDTVIPEEELALLRIASRLSFVDFNDPKYLTFDNNSRITKVRDKVSNQLFTPTQSLTAGHTQSAIGSDGQKGVVGVSNRGGYVSPGNIWPVAGSSFTSFHIIQQNTGGDVYPQNTGDVSTGATLMAHGYNSDNSLRTYMRFSSALLNPAASGGANTGGVSFIIRAYDAANSLLRLYKNNALVQQFTSVTAPNYTDRREMINNYRSGASSYTANLEGVGNCYGVWGAYFAPASDELNTLMAFGAARFPSEGW